MEAKLYGQGCSSFIIEGSIKNCTIANNGQLMNGDLVKIIDEIRAINHGTNSAISILGAYHRFESIALSDNRVFIVYASTASSLYGVVCKMEGANIVCGTLTVLASSGTYPHVKQLPDGRLFISYGHSSSTLHGLICTVDGMTVTLVSSQQLSSLDRTAYDNNLTVLEDGNVFISYEYDRTNRYLYGTIATISGDTITPNTETALSTTTYTCNNDTSCETFINNTVLIAHSYSSNDLAYLMNCQINGLVITVKSDTQIGSSNYSAEAVSIKKLSNEKALVLHRDHIEYYVYGRFCTVATDSTVTIGSKTLLTSSSEPSGEHFSAALTADNKLFIAHAYGGNSRYLYGRVIILGENTFTPGTDTLLLKTTFAGRDTSVAILSNGIIFLPYGNQASDTVFARLLSINSSNIPVAELIEQRHVVEASRTLTSQFDGIVKTGGEGTDIISVYTKKVDYPLTSVYNDNSLGYVHFLNTPIMYYHNDQTAKMLAGEYISDQLQVTQFTNPYLTFPGMEPKQINGVINANTKYNLIYNGNTWSIV